MGSDRGNHGEAIGKQWGSVAFSHGKRLESNGGTGVELVPPLL